MKYFIISLLYLFLLHLNKYSVDCFAECPSTLADPNIPNVNTCVQWAAFLQSNGTNVITWCQNPQVSQKCCFTCQTLYRNFAPCADNASESDCRAKAAQGLCDTFLSTNERYSFYCRRSCGLCTSQSGPRCADLGNLCTANGVCTAATFFGITTSVCSCRNNFLGANCTRVDVCASNATNPCRNGARCTGSNEEDVLYTCECPAGCSGKNCDICGCQAGGSFACLNGATCASSGVCQCPLGFTGQTCATFIGCNAGGTLACLNNGLCTSSGFCLCPVGFTGTVCQTFLGCLSGGSLACQNGATCNSATGICICPLGFTGTTCATFSGCNVGGSLACQNGATCLTNGTCACAFGFSGQNCNVSLGCVAGGSLSCLNGGLCQTNGACICTPGFTGPTCAIFIGCNAGGILRCLNNGLCLTNGSCLCTLGFVGQTCQTFAGCTLGGSLACLNGATCGSNGICTCASGFTGSTCATYSGCNLGGTLACANGATCQSNGFCLCTSGFTGLTCSTFSGCNLGGTLSCLNGATCQSNGTCACLPGFSGTRCEQGNACTVTVCQNGATCSISANNTAICACRPGFFGARCQTTNACQSGANGQSPCLNGATCRQESQLPIGYFCSCPANFFGINCQVQATNLTCSSPDMSSVFCPIWANSGYCDYKFLFQLIPIPVYCPFSCGRCSSPSVASCRDTQSNCAVWATLNLCSTLNSINPNICRRSCGLCNFRR